MSFVWNAYSCHFWRFRGICPLNGEACRPNPKRNILACKDIIWHVDHQNLSAAVTCVCDEETSKRRTKRNLTLANWATQPPHPRPQIKMKFGSGIVFEGCFKYQVSWKSVELFQRCGGKYFSFHWFGLYSCHRGVATGGGYIGIYTPPLPPKNQSSLQICMWLLVVFFLFEPAQIVVDFEIGMTS